jgi:tetratricopeptide (TPR) repeat protein
MNELMDKTQLAEYLGIKIEDIANLFPAPPVFVIVGYEKYKLAEIKEWLDEIIASQHQAKARQAKVIYKSAQDLQVEKKYEQASEIFKNAIALDRTQPDYHFNYGFCLYHLENFELSEIEMRKALEQDPKGDWRDAAKYHIELIENKRIEDLKKENLNVNNE